jgi:hypothetical protein
MEAEEQERTDTYRPRQRILEPWSAERIEAASAAYRRVLPEASLDAEVVRPRVLAREQGVRLVVRRAVADGRLRHRLRRRRDGACIPS